MTQILYQAKTETLETRRIIPIVEKHINDGIESLLQNTKVRLFIEIFTASIIKKYTHALEGESKLPEINTYMASSLESVQPGMEKAFEKTVQSFKKHELLASYIAPAGTVAVDLAKSVLSQNDVNDINIHAIKLISKLAGDPTKLLNLLNEVLVAILRDDKIEFLNQESDRNITAFAIKFATGVLNEYIEQNQTSVPTHPIKICGKLQTILEQCFDSITEYKEFLEIRLDDKKASRKTKHDIKDEK